MHIKCTFRSIIYVVYRLILMRMIRIGFVLQDDIVFPHLTVKETLTYAALLRLPNTLTREQKKERVMDIISELDLERYFLIISCPMLYEN